jgi:uncharacterized protein
MKDVKHWHYVVSELCNMNCTYCNVDVNNKLRLDEAYFDEFMLNLTEPFVFSIFGGEVFLQLDIVEYIINKLESHPNLIQIVITTNGTIYNKTVKKIVEHPNIRTTISYDGIFQEAHRGNHRIYIRSLIEAGATHGHCMINGIDMQDNILIKQHEALIDVGLVPDMTLVRDIGSWNDEQVQTFNKEFTKYINYLGDFKQYKTYNEIPGLIKTYLNPVLEFFMKGHEQEDCGVGTSYWAITPQKKIVACERFERDSTTLLTNKYIVTDVCDKCDISQFCHRGCTYEQIKNKAPIAELCEIYKYINKEITELISRTRHTLLILFEKENM